MTVGEFVCLVKGLRGEPDVCWQWPGRVDRYGYGIVRVGDDRRRRAHRAVYRLLVGQIPLGHDLHHVCEMKACVNPAHLNPVPHEHHVKLHERTHCKHGHEFNQENTYVWRKPGTTWVSRCCRACNRETQRRYSNRKQASK